MSPRFWSSYWLVETGLATEEKTQDLPTHTWTRIACAGLKVTWLTWFRVFGQETAQSFPQGVFHVSFGWSAGVARYNHAYSSYMFCSECLGVARYSHANYKPLWVLRCQRLRPYTLLELFRVISFNNFYQNLLGSGPSGSKGWSTSSKCSLNIKVGNEVAPCWNVVYGCGLKFRSRYLRVNIWNTRKIKSLRLIKPIQVCDSAI